MNNFSKLARELHAAHGLLPVPVAGKVPLGGTGWNLMPLARRLSIVDETNCTGLGIQFGLVFHPVHGPLEARGLDCDIDDPAKRNAFASTLQSLMPLTQWRWGRRPATIVFTEPGVIKTEKFGPVQLLGAGKQAVWYGAYINKQPLSTDPPQYWHQGPDILDRTPPIVPAALLKAAIESSLHAAGYDLMQKSMLIEATPLSTADLATLTEANMREFEADIKSMLIDLHNSPIGSGRGTKLHQIGIKYGALIKASGHAPLLVDAAREVSPNMVEYEQLKKHAFLARLGQLAENTYFMLPGSLAQGDRRDFARGVGASKGLAQSVAVTRIKHALPVPGGRGYPGQTATDLLNEDLPPLRFLVSQMLTDSGCIIVAGKPKIGKGWVVLELGISITEGGMFWGEQCEQAEALMYMLEDSKRRVRERLGILRPFKSESSDGLRFRYSVDGPFFVNADGSGTLLEDIREHVRCFPAIKLVVIDVLQRIRGVSDKNDDAYQKDYKIIGTIQKLATELNLLIIVVHHLKKGRVDDAIDSINGSYGIAGATDGSIIIAKDGDIIRATGIMRDTKGFDFELLKEGNSPMWKPAQTMVEPNEGTKTQAVLTALHAAACALTAGDVAIRTGVSEKNVATYLSRLLKSFQIIRPSRGLYMAKGMPHRERMEGVIELLKRCPKTKATIEVKEKYAPDSAPPEASYMILTAVAIREIEAGFVNGKDALQSLKHRGLASFNSDTVWLIGEDWEVSKPIPAPNPFASKFKMPWENL